MENSDQKRYLIGIQPTGRLHLGNYLGCIKKGVDLQREGHNVYFMVAQYHELMNSGVDKNVYDLEIFDELHALGAKDGTMYLQDNINLKTYILLSSKVSLNQLKKLPQYKEKSENTIYDFPLLSYPVLMAGDILTYKPHYVLVGRDQIAHIEFANDLYSRAGIDYRANYIHGHLESVRSIKDPSKKMSKSLGDDHVIYCFDDYEKKVMKSVSTPEGRENLFNIAKCFNMDMSKYETEYSMKEFKIDLINTLENHFSNIPYITYEGEAIKSRGKYEYRK